MRREPKRITKEFCRESTARTAGARKALDESQARIDADKDQRYREYAQRDLDKSKLNFDQDPKRESRIAQHRCIPCFYLVRLAGAAITYQPCGLCGKDQAFSSTSTDVVCVDCARAHAMCSHCGADIDGDAAREDYPETEEDRHAT